MPDSAFVPLLAAPARAGFRAAVADRPATSPTRFDVGGGAGVPAALLAVARERAHAEGWAAGFAEGRSAGADAVRVDVETAARAKQIAIEEARAELVGVVRTLQDAAMVVERRRDATAAELVDHVVAGVAELVGAVLGRELADGEDTPLDALRRAVRPLPRTVAVTVALAPDDARVLHGAAHLMEATATLEGREVTIVADPTLARGDAVATTHTSRVESRLADALARAVEALTA